MTKIKNYPLDLQVNGGDKWIGTDSASLAKLTKNFTPDNLAAYYNNSEVVQVVNQMRFFYDTVDPGDDRAIGSFSFPTEVGPTVPFSSITDLVFSKYTMGNDAVNNFMTDIVNSIIIIQKSDNPDIYAFYALNAYTVDPLDANFYNVELSFESGNGSVEEDEDYLIGLIQFAGASGVQTILGSTFIDSTLTGVGEVTISLSATGTPSNLTGLRGDNTWGTLGLESLDEGNGAGWRLIGRDAANYGNIGEGAIDFSNSDSISTERGSVGTSAITFGYNNINQQTGTLMIGSLNNAEITDIYQGQNFITGYDIDVYGAVYNSFIGMYRGTVGVQGTNYVTNAIYQSVVVGDGANFYAGRDAGAVGGGLISGSTGVFTVGIANEDLTTTTSNYLTSQYNNYGPRFIVGCGTYNPVSQVATRANGFVVMSDGTATFPLLTNALIDAANDDSAVTKGWVNSGPALTSEQVRIEVKNTSGVTLVKGTPVYITGTVGATIRAEVAAADASSSATMPAVGVLLQDLINNEDGFAVTGGFLTNITTDPIDGLTPTENDTVYVKAGGGLTLTKPTGSDLIQNIAKVGKVSGGNAGSLVISSILRTNDVPNLTTGKIWVGTATNTAESGVVYLDEGNVRMGIGTTSPTASLHVNGSSGNTATFQGATQSTLNLLAGSASNYLVGTTAGDISLRPNGSTSVTLKANGRVGIGTTSPSYNLDIQSESPAIRIRDISDANSFLVGADNSGGYLGMFTNDSLRVYTNSLERMRITDTGNVGIGTTTPSDKLDVAGDIAINGSKFAKIDSSYTYLYKSNTNAVGIYLGGTTDQSNYYDNNSHYFRNSGGSSTRMIINSSGNVGIGTTSPSYKLELGSGDFSLPLGSFIRFGSQIGITKASNSKLSIYGGTGATTAGGVDLYRWDGAAYSTALRLSNTGQIQLDEYGSGTFTGTATQRLAVDSSGNVIEIPIGSGPVDGSGTANYVTKWSDADTITDSVIYDDGTNIGIGTTTPSEKLEVAGDIAIVDSIGALNFVYSSTPSRVARFDSDNGNLRIKADINSSQANSFISFELDGSEKARINSTGNVGIGTTNPTHRLYVQGNNGTLLVAREITTPNQVRIGIGENNPSTALDFGSYSDGIITGAASLRFSNGTRISQFSTSRLASQADAGFFFYPTGTNPSADVYGVDIRHLRDSSINTTDAVLEVNNSANSSLMLVRSDGNVGIGITSPRAKLEVKGTGGNASGLILSNSNEIFRQYFTGDAIGSTFAMTYDGTGGNDFQIQSDGDIILADNTGGNVGIGTTTPAAKLDVNGDSSYSSDYNFLSISGTKTGGTAVTDVKGIDLSIGSGDIVAGNDITNLYGAYINNNTSGGSASVIGNWYGVYVPPADANRVSNRVSAYFGDNVGIGTTTPARELTIGDGTTDARIRTYYSDGSYAETWGGGIIFNRTASYLRPEGDNTQTLYIGSALNTWQNLNLHAQTTTFNTEASGEAMRINSSGHVGIGTTSPGNKLHILRNDTSSNAHLRIEQEGTGDATIDYSITGVNVWKVGIDNSNGDAFTFARGTFGTGLDVMALKGSNVGIGTTSPSYLLHVDGGVIGSNVDSTGNNTSRQVNMTSANTTGMNAFTSYSTNTDVTPDFLGKYGYKLEGGIATANKQFQVYVSDAANPRMIVNGSGNVGIGDTAPTSKLSVLASLNTYAAQYIRNAGTGAVLELNQQGTGNIFEAFDNSSSVFVIKDGGNVGIGTTSPGNTLHVNGVAYAVSGLFGVDGGDRIQISNRATNDVAVESFAAELFLSSGFNGISFEGSANTTLMKLTDSGDLGIGTTTPAAKLDVNGGVRIADDAATASATNVGTLRYRTSGNNSYVDMCMQTGAATYAWVNIVQNNW